MIFTNTLKIPHQVHVRWRPDQGGGSEGHPQAPAVAASQAQIHDTDRQEGRRDLNVASSLVYIR